MPHILWRSFVWEIMLNTSSWAHPDLSWARRKTAPAFFASVNEHWRNGYLSLAIETDYGLWKMEWNRTTRNKKLPLSCVIRNMPCLMVLLQLTRPDWWSWGTRLNRGCKGLCVHGMHEFEGVDSWSHHALTPRRNVEWRCSNVLTNFFKIDCYSDE